MGSVMKTLDIAKENLGTSESKKKEHKEPYPIDPLFWSYLYDSISRKECGLGENFCESCSTKIEDDDK